MGKRALLLTLTLLTTASLHSSRARAQSFGTELYATMMPASGGMGGTSIARPQDLQASLASNPATLAQFRGTNFSFGGGWVEPTVNVDNDANLPLLGIVPYSERSESPGVALGNIGVTQDYSALGLPMTFGLGLLAGSGVGVDFVDAVGDLGEPNASNGTSALLQTLDIGAGVGLQMTENIAIGMEAVVSSSTLDGPFVGIGSATVAYGLRGNFGITADLTENTTLGFTWLTRQSFQFEDAILLQVGGSPPTFTTALDLELDRPETFGWGLANDRLLDGKLLIAADILYNKWSDTDFFGAIWDDQFVFQTGAQLEVNRRLRLRLGYAYAEEIMRDLPNTTIGGVLPPGGIAAAQYTQAQFPAINQHRFSGGVGIRDLLPGVDFDIFAGGMFGSEEQLGATSVSVESYWVGFGTTWRFGRGACEDLPVPDDWN